MKIQHAITLLVLVTVLCLIGAAEWSQSRQATVENRNAFFTQLESQTTHFERTLNMRIQTLRTHLAQAASRHTDSHSGLTSAAPFSAIAWLVQNPEGSPSKYRAVWAEANSQTFDPSWLKGLNFSRIKDGESLFVRRVDRHGDAFFALVMTAVAQEPQLASLPEQASSQETEDKVYLFAAVTASTFSAWVDEWVGSSRAAFVFDENGNIVTHSQRQFFGTNLKEDQLVNAALRSGRAKVTSDYSDLQGEKRVGESLRLAQTNLRVAISAPHSALNQQLASQKSSERNIMLLIGFALVALTYFFSDHLAKKLSRQQHQAYSESLPTNEAQDAQVANQTVVPELVISQELSGTPTSQPLTFEVVEEKTRLNIEEILARSAEIRQRLQIDFVESVTQEQNALLDEMKPPEEQESEAEVELALHEPPPKVKVRRPKVSL